MLPTFIRLENTFEKAVTIQGSPQDKFFSFEGVHLMSNPPFERGYIQRTYATDGIEIENIDLGWFDTCGNELSTPNQATFNVLRNFNDPQTGLPQVEWELIPNGVDFGRQLVIMRIQTGVNVFVYSSPFVLTDTGSEYTSFWAYRNKNQMLHIGLEMYRRNFMSTQAVDNYTSTSGDIVAGVNGLTKNERWFTGIVNSLMVEEFKVFTQCREVYSIPMFDDGLPQRTYFFDETDSVEPEADENFGQVEFIINRNSKYTYNPDSLPLVPPQPPEFAPKINLTAVVSENTTKVRFEFDIENFDADYMYLGFSADSITWTETAFGGNYVDGGEYSQLLTVPNHQTNNYYYRVRHSLATSDVLQLPKAAITISNIVKPNPSDSTRYRIAFSTESYTPVKPFIFMFSEDSIKFEQALYTDGNESPKDLLLPRPISEPFFRIDSQDMLLSSNVLKYEE